jgi:hypothetical protein
LIRCELHATTGERGKEQKACANRVLEIDVKNINEEVALVVRQKSDGDDPRLPRRNGVGPRRDGERVDVAHV